MAARNRLRGEVGKGTEALRHERVNFLNIVANNKTLVACVGPFDTDIDVQSAVVTSAVLIASNASNTLDLFNGTVTGAVKITTQIRPDTTALTAQVPLTLTLNQANVRVTAGTPIVVRLVLPGDSSGTPADLHVRIGYDIPIYDFKGAKITTYGGYDDGI